MGSVIVYRDVYRMALTREVTMNRRSFVSLGCAFPLANLQPPPGFLWPDVLAANQTTKPSGPRQSVLVRAGFTRQPDGKEEATTSQQTVVRSFDSEGRLAAFVVPVGEHSTYRGAPLHVHHEQDEWIHIVAGEFVVEVGGQRMRLKPGDSLLMPMQIPHRWSVAGQPHCGAIHLYTPAGLMETDWNLTPDDGRPETLAQHKVEFERHRLTLLGDPLTKEEIDRIV
jgi:mannose-6-phosphate isomerase-like protein (cupin superfamily)